MKRSPQSWLIRQATLVNEGQRFCSDLRIEDGRIAQIASSIEPHKDDWVIDATGLWLLPGMIDDQVHFREPGLTHKADIASESRACAAGGITSFMEMPNTRPPALDRDSLEAKYAIAAQSSVVNYAFYMGASNDNLEAIRAIDPKSTPGVKVFMGASTGNMLVDDPEVLNGIFRDSPVTIITHCEDSPMIEDNLQKALRSYGEGIPAHLHPLIRSREACIKSTQLAIELARKHNARLHVLHISTAEELELFEPGPLASKRITAETCVHFLHFNDRDYQRLGCSSSAIRRSRQSAIEWRLSGRWLKGASMCWPLTTPPICSKRKTLLTKKLRQVCRWCSSPCKWHWNGCSLVS
jgi:dihydroorotase